MFALICGLILIIVFTVITIKDDDYDLGAFFISLLVGLLGFLVGAFLSLLITAGAQNVAEMQTIETEKTEIVALADSSAIEGTRYLTGGYIDEELVYYYMYQDGNKGFTQDKIDADNCYIKYIDKDEKPYLLTEIKKPKSKVLDFFTSGLMETRDDTFYLPQGSIVAIDTYEIDLK